MDDKQELFTAGDAAHYLGVTRQRLDLLGSEGRIPRTRLGRWWTYQREDLDRWLNEERRPGGRPRLGDEIKTEAPVLAAI